MQQELDCFHKHNVWTVVPKQKGIKTVPVKWIFGIKNDGKYKARLLVVGC